MLLQTKFSYRDRRKLQSRVISFYIHEQHTPGGAFFFCPFIKRGPCRFRQGPGCSRLQAVPLVNQIAVQSKVLHNVLQQLLHQDKTPFLSFETRSPVSGHIQSGAVKLQTQVLGHVLAVQRKVRSQDLDHLLHRGQISFRLI